MIIPLHSPAAQQPGAGASTGGAPKFDPLLDSITDGIVSVDRDWRVTYLNAVSERLSGRSRESLLGKELWAELPDLSRTPFAEAFRQAMATGNRATLTDYYPPTDSWFEIRVFPSSAGLVLILRDITDMRQAEVERLRLLAAERSARQQAEHTADRLKRLEGLTAQLAPARSPEEVMSFAAGHIMASVGANLAMVGLPLVGQDLMRTVAYDGLSRQLHRDAQLLPLSAPLPVPATYRTGQPEWLESPKELAARYPELHATPEQPPARALASLPMLVEGKVVGVLALCFPEPRAFSGEDRDFLLALARHCALAMERARLLAEVEAQRARLEELVMRAPAVMSVTRGPEHRFVLCNPRYRQLIGGRDLTGRSAREALPELQGQALLEIMDRVYATGEPFVGKEFPLRLGPGGDLPTENYFDFVYQPLRDAEGRVEGLASFAFEVTNQVHARRTVEELLRDMARSEERFRAFLTSTADIIWDTPPTGAFDSDQPGWRSFTGQTRDELLGWGWLEAVHPEDREQLARGWRQAATGTEPFQGEARLRRHDGVYRHMQVRAVPVLELNGAVREWVGIYRDITRQREDEAEKARLMAESQAANRAKDEFLAVMSHELRTPLTAVLGWTQMLRSRKDDPAVREKGLEVIERNARSLSQLIEDVLDVSRILTGKLALHRKPVELAGVVQAAVEVVRPRAEQKGVKLELVEMGTGTGQVLGDPGRLQQVFWNLLVNAVKFTPEGGQVEVRAERGEGEWRVRVKDSGQGISKEALPHLFERFWQADGSSTREHGGLGLGLAIVRHLAELHGGSVEAESAGLGKGATFTVRLPIPAVLPEPERAAASGDGAARMARLDGVRVLLVEDADDARELLTLLLRERGAEVRTAVNGREAMERLMEALPDVLVSDIGLPGEDGHTLLKRIREWTEARDQWLPAIALTAYAGAEDARKAYRAGFQVHMAKPLEAESLVESVARLAGRDEAKGSVR